MLLLSNVQAVLQPPYGCRESSARSPSAIDDVCLARQTYMGVTMVQAPPFTLAAMQEQPVLF